MAFVPLFLILLSAWPVGGPQVRADEVGLTAREESGAGAAPTTGRDRVIRAGVTFIFDGEYPVGRYCNGDWFVVAPEGVAVREILPLCEEVTSKTDSGDVIEGRIINGTVVNPVGAINGWDSFTGVRGANVYASYDADRNIDPGKTGEAYGAQPGETLVKAVSRRDTLPDNARSTIERFVSLTVVSAPPPEGAFRPPLGGEFKDIPKTWTEDNIDWNRVPAIDLESVSLEHIDWPALSKQALGLWQVFDPWGNRSRNIVPREVHGIYRRAIGRQIGTLLRSLVTEAGRETKRDVMVGMIQLGIDQIPAVYYQEERDPGRSALHKRWDIGRRAPSVLSALMLPDTGWIEDALAIRFRWQDTSSYGVIDEDMIVLTDDETEPGPMAGMEGMGDWQGARSRNALGRTPFTAAYRRIGHTSQFIGVTAIHLFDGADDIYDGDGVVRYNDRWNALVEAGWPGIGTADGYQVSGNNPAPGDYDFFREVRPAMPPEFVATKPERPEPPGLEDAGTALIVTPKTPPVGHGKPVSQIDIRYRKLATDEEGTLEPAGDWAVVEDVEWDADGRFIISPTEYGGLEENTNYAVAIRYHNTIGAGAWSRNWTFGGDAWAAGVVQTAEQVEPGMPVFTDEPALEGFFSERRPIRVAVGRVEGFPAPAFEYRWKLDGEEVEGADGAVFTPGIGDAGRIPSCEITATNAEGTVTFTATGPALAEYEAQSYRPRIYENRGNIQSVGSGILSTSQSSRMTVAWWGAYSDPSQNYSIFSSSHRSSLSVRENGVVRVVLRGFGGQARGAVDFEPVESEELAWYMVVVDLEESEPEDRIRLYYRGAGCSFPPRRVRIETMEREPSYRERFQIARGRNPSFMPSNEAQMSLSDHWMQNGVARPARDFFNASGYPVDPRTVGEPDLLMGADMNEADWNARRNLGSAMDPMEKADEEGMFEKTRTME